MKSSYIQAYTNLNNKINENREKINLLKDELEEVKALESKAEIDLMNEEFKLINLEHQKNILIMKKDILISVPITILTIIVEVFLISSCYNIVVLPEEIVSKILVGILTASIGGCTCIATVLCFNALTRKLQGRLHEHIEKNDSEYQKIVEKIENENLRLEPKRSESKRLSDKVYEIKRTLSQTQESINIDLKKLENIKNEIVNLFVSEEESNNKIIKPNIRVRSKLN